MASSPSLGVSQIDQASYLDQGARSNRWRRWGNVVARQALLEQVPNLDEQLLVFRRGRRSDRLLLLIVHDPPQELDDEEEQGRGHNHEADDLVDERPQIEDVFLAA